MQSAQWRDTRDMTADGHTKGSIDRDMLIQVMGGTQSFNHDLKRQTPYRAGQTRSPEPPEEQSPARLLACEATC
eukprot:1815857-Pyramimonas_sp.AAC.1